MCLFFLTKLVRRPSSSRQGRKSDTKKEEKTKRFKCVFEGCNNKEFSRMYHLKRHVRLVHKQDPAQVPGLERKKRESGVRSSGGRGLSKRKKKGSKGTKKGENTNSEKGRDILEDVRNDDGYDNQPQEEDDQFEGQNDTGNLEETIIIEVNQDPVICILCTSFYIPSAKMGVSQLLNELVYQVDGGGGGGSSSSNFKSSEVERLSVCSQCRKVAGSVVEKRREVDLIEVEVRRLQLQILKETRRLEKMVADYQMEWRKLEGVVNESDVACLEEWLGRNAGEGKTEDNSLVLRLRDGIVSGGNPLASYHKGLATKLCYSQDDLNENRDADEYPDDRSGSKRKLIAKTRRSQQKVKVTPPPQPEEIPSTYSKAPEVEQDEECDDYDPNPSPVEAVNEVGDVDVGPTSDDNGPQENATEEDEDADEVPDFNAGAVEMSECEQYEDPESGSADVNEVANEEEEEMHSKPKRKPAEVSRKTEKSKSATGDREKCGKVGEKKQDAILKRGLDAYKLTAFKQNQLRTCDDSESRKRQKKETEHGTSHRKYSSFPPSNESPGFADKSFLSKYQIAHSVDRPYLCSKGCGASYKQGKHWLRHEKLCEGGWNGEGLWEWEEGGQV